MLPLGDFNARMGVLKQGDEMWDETIGRHGLDGRNAVREEFLHFCALNQLTVMNISRVPEEKHLHVLRHLDASSNKSVSCNRPNRDEGEAEGSLQGCAADERIQLLDRP